MNNRKITIGRSTGCDIVLADISVSRLHAELELLENKRLLLTDCHSSQGTFVIQGEHEKKVKQQTISKQDVLKFGSIKISVSEILTATQLYDQNVPIVEIEESLQNNHVSDSMIQAPIKKPQQNDHSEETQSFFKLFFSFDGRVSRSTYWLKYMLPYLVIYLVLIVVDANTGSLDYSTGYGTYTAIFALLGIVPTFAIGIKRCHDRNRTGWFFLVSLVPLLNIWVLIELWFLKGTDGDNKYGSDPLL